MTTVTEPRKIKLNSKARAKLIAAARKVMARDGIETSSIPDIVTEAGVGRGSFYNHFESKEELARVVFLEQTAAMRNEFNALSQHTGDIPRAMCYTLRRCFEMTLKDALWGSFIVHAERSLQDFERLMGESAYFGISRGVALGVMSITDMPSTMVVLQSSVTGLMGAMLKGTIGPDQLDAALVLLLRIVGVDDQTAVEIASEPMEELLRKISGST